MKFRNFPLAVIIFAAISTPVIGNAQSLNEIAQFEVNGTSENSVDVDGNTAVVGVPRGVSAINGGVGSVRIYSRIAGVWSQTATLSADNLDRNDLFGDTVVIDGNTIVVGSPEDDDLGDNSGAVYVYERSGETWALQAKLTADDGGDFDAFGDSLAIDGETILIGATETGSESSIESDDHHFGSAYVFTRNANTWTQQAKLLDPIPSASGSQFGFSLSIDGDTALIGAQVSDTDGRFSRTGAAFVYVRENNVWSLQTTLVSDDIVRLDGFGASVSISGNTAAIGTPGDVHGDVTRRRGSTYMFERSSGGTWTQTQMLTADNNSSFGLNVDLEGDTLTVVNFRTGQGESSDEGAVLVYQREGAQWGIQGTLQSSVVRRRFGREIALQGNSVIVFSDHLSPNTPTVYFFDITPFVDSDNDGISDDVDNCPSESNPDQLDVNENGTGDACEIFDDGSNDNLVQSTVLSILDCLDADEPGVCGRNAVTGTGFNRARLSRAVLGLGAALPRDTVVTIVNEIDQWPSDLTNGEINRNRIALMSELGLARQAARYWAVLLIAREIN